MSSRAAPTRADAQRRPDKSAGVSVVFTGSFNPGIFQPEWFMRHGLIPDDEESVELEAVTPQIASWRQDWLSVVAGPERCDFNATDEAASFHALVDLAVGTFTLLPHVPVTAFGVNRFAHFQMESEKAWNALGLSLFVRKPWEDVIEDPRMLTVQVQAYEADDSGGRMAATVQPSARFRNAVFVSTNDHYAQDAEDARDALDLLQRVFERSIEHSAAIIDRIRAL